MVAWELEAEWKLGVEWARVDGWEEWYRWLEGEGLTRRGMGGR
jgi:hypothetical protein